MDASDIGRSLGLACALALALGAVRKARRPRTPSRSCVTFFGQQSDARHRAHERYCVDCHGGNLKTASSAAGRCASPRFEESFGSAPVQLHSLGDAARPARAHEPR